MSILYDNDFSSFSPGATPPYGSLFNVSVVVPTIGNAIPGAYGDPNYVTMPSLPALIYPQLNPDNTIPAFVDLSLFMMLRLGPTGVDQQGTLLSVNSNLNPFAGATILTISMNSDGSFTAQSDLGGDRAVSDLSVMEEKWMMIQITAHFFAFFGSLRMDTKIAVNGQLAINSSLLSNRSIASMPAIYWNNLVLGGCAGGSQMGRVTIYDTIQTIGVNPHPGTPEARVSQAIIELIKIPGSAPPPTGGGSLIYEA